MLIPPACINSTKLCNVARRVGLYSSVACIVDALASTFGWEVLIVTSCKTGVRGGTLAPNGFGSQRRFYLVYPVIHNKSVLE